MIKSEWDKLKSSLTYGDNIAVSYRCNWHRGRAYKKADKEHTGLVFWLDDERIEFYDGKVLSYKSITSVKMIKNTEEGV